MVQGQYIGDVPNMFADGDNLVIDLGAFRYIMPISVARKSIQRTQAILDGVKTSNVVPIYQGCRKCGSGH